MPLKSFPSGSQVLKFSPFNTICHWKIADEPGVSLPGRLGYLRIQCCGGGVPAAARGRVAAGGDRRTGRGLPTAGPQPPGPVPGRQWHSHLLQSRLELTSLYTMSGKPIVPAGKLVNLHHMKINFNDLSSLIDVPNVYLYLKRYLKTLVMCFLKQIIKSMHDYCSNL